MKEFVKIILDNFLAWLIGIIVVGFLLAYCCWNPETVMNKFNELMDLAARFIKFGG